jgi:hypothetical protein
MRCIACNQVLTSYESTRKHADTGEYLDLCGECLSVIHSDVHFPVLDRPDLLGSDDILDIDPTDREGFVDDNPYF